MSDSVIARLSGDVMKMVIDASNKTGERHGDPELSSAHKKEKQMAEKLIDLKLKDYLELLKSDAPAPGGGSVSALAGAQGAGLVMMAIDLTVGKEKFAEYEEACLGAKEELTPVYEGLVEGIDKDTEAFNMVMAAFGMPKETDEEKAARKEAIQEGTIESTRTPFHNMELALAGLKACEKIEGKVNPNCLSDFGVGVMNLKLCVLGAWMNVKINIPGIKNEKLAEDYAGKAEKIAKEAVEIADRLYNE